jgi:tetratricopeptide (TPR) repeat protein
MWNPGVGRCRALVFVLLVVLFLTGMTGFRVWGWHWAAAAYRPLLLETVSAARTSQVFGDAETALLKAVETTPAYACTVLDTVYGELPVLPELGARLAHNFDEDAASGRRRGQAALNALRVRFGRGAYQEVLARAPLPEGEGGSWQADYFRGKSRSFLGQGPDPGMTCAVRGSSRGMVPEIREALRVSRAVRDSLSPNREDLVAKYLSASANLDLGDWGAARRELADLAGDIAHLPDIAYRLGLMAELDGNPEEALTWYARAVAASDSHADAAAACLRLQSRAG